MKQLPRSATRSQLPPPARWDADSPEIAAPLCADWPRLFAWLPIPLLLVAIFVLWVAKELPRINGVNG
jgi:hypothetical protein